jgi:GMP synthase-like glutamine amidotransferase
MSGQPEDESTPPSEATPEVDNSQQPDTTDWKKRYDDSSKEARKIAEEKARKEAMLLNIAVDRVVSDPSYLESLASTDQELAETVAKSLQVDGEDFTSLDEALAYVKTLTKESPKIEKPIDTDKLYEEFKKRQEKEQTTEYIEDLFSKIPTDKRDEIRNDFNDLIEGKSNITKERAKKYFDMVNTYKTPKKQETVDKKMAEMASGSVKNSASKEYEEVPASVIALAKQLGKEHLYLKK